MAIKAESTNSDDIDGDLRHRLGVLTERYSQSEIARRTGTSRANVSNYLLRSRPPAAFCIALCQQLGVNPEWLLLGEGVPFHEDNPRKQGGTRSSAELLKQLRRVSRKRMGALLGKQEMLDLKALMRELETFERTRAVISETLDPVLQHLLERLQHSISTREYARAEELIKAAERVARLGASHELEQQVARRRSQLAYLRGQGQAALDPMRLAMGRSFADTTLTLDQRLEDVMVFVHNAQQLHYYKEARRYLEAFLAVLPDDAEHRDLDYLRNFRGFLLLFEGEVRKARAVLEERYSKMTLRYQQNMTAAMESARALYGDATAASCVRSYFKNAIERKAELARYGLMLFDFASLDESAKALAAFERHLAPTLRDEPRGVPEYLVKSTLLVLEAARAPREGIIAEIIEAGEAMEHPDKVIMDIRINSDAARAARIMGDWKETLTYSRRLERAISSLPPEREGPLTGHYKQQINCRYLLEHVGKRSKDRPWIAARAKQLEESVAKGAKLLERWL